MRHSSSSADPPGPDFLGPLEASFYAQLPEVLARADQTLHATSQILGLSLEEWRILNRSLMGYYLLFVETALELKGTPLITAEEAAKLQLLVLIHWRNLDTLHDADSLQLSRSRHQELARLASTYIQKSAQSLGIDWEGEPGRQYQAFQIQTQSVKVDDALPGKDPTEVFLRDHFVLEPEVRASFLYFVPRYILRVKEDELVWYRFYTFVVTLDDDLDDALADAIAGRDTPTVRYLTRLGVFKPGRAGSFPRYYRFLTSFFIRQLDLCIRLANRENHKAASINLSMIREATMQKLREV